MDKTTIVGRLDALRNKMTAEEIDMVLISSTDCHGSEYVADYFKVTEFFSGCTSDNVMMLITEKNAYLWTDGRYFLSAEAELKDTGITLMKSGEPGVPTLNMFLDQNLEEGMVLAYDGCTIRCDRGSMFRQIAMHKGAAVRGDFLPAEGIWEDRPTLPSGKITHFLSKDMTGESIESKLVKIREKMKLKKATAMVIAKPDDIMWIFNVRGNDIPYNPVAISYCIILGNEVNLYIPGYEAEDLKKYAKENGFNVYPYDLFFEDLKEFDENDRIWLDYVTCSDRILEILSAKGITSVVGTYPSTELKAKKNPEELRRLRECYRIDSLILCRFLYYVQKTVGKEPMTECSLADKLDYMRSTISDYLDLSFETISAYGPNAAIVHYEPKAGEDLAIEAKGFYLVDSGGQYLSGTTDVTRTIALGEITDEMRKDFTLVTIANLRLLNARFLYGCTGANLDMYARSALWEHAVDYKHGTGHGIGFILNVHEGPQNIGWRILSPASGKLNSEGVKTVFEPGMITSDEPGIYRDGEYGIRIETIMECVEDEYNEYGQFLRFCPLTYVPIDLNSLDLSLMDASDKKRLNEYHKAVFEKIAPGLTDEKELAWLKEATREV